jgi:GTP cyclohydrolase I
MTKKCLDPHEAVRALISFIGDDPDRPGLRDTPERVLRAWAETWGAGYVAEQFVSTGSLIKLFDEEAIPANAETDISRRYNEMVFVQHLAVYSHCEHHLTPFWGTATIAYLPTYRGIVGLSKLARVAEHFARRLQVQERLTSEIADALAEHLSPHVGVMLNCRHFCMMSRGVAQPNATTRTTALRGVFETENAVKHEFLDGCK